MNNSALKLAKSWLGMTLLASATLPAFASAGETAAAPVSANILKVAATDWCPQTCENSAQAGYILDVTQAVFAQSEYHLVVEYFPWTRAVRLTEQGQFDLLLGPTKTEAPNLRFPVAPVGQQKMCFFTKADSSWRYQGVESLQGQQIGVILDASLGEINDYKQANPHQFQVLSQPTTYLKQSIAKLRLNRIDSFLFTQIAVEYELAQQNVQEEFINAGCVAAENIYVAFSPKMTAAKLQQVMTVFDKRMAELQRQNAIKPIMQGYGISY
ncbi:substrate-binding periplasmic protein [Shewanella waksmanii]|uniref:substrate-binding periplasmic protein n=1 Tax=Shewanella waksmanii TaxID=213783 RepID=UPI00048DCAAF|nr:ABC transporter substrate-binding protein [Shewanella waksmanii]